MKRDLDDVPSETSYEQEMYAKQIFLQILATPQIELPLEAKIGLIHRMLYVNRALGGTLIRREGADDRGFWWQLLEQHRASLPVHSWQPDEWTTEECCRLMFQPSVGGARIKIMVAPKVARSLLRSLLLQLAAPVTTSTEFLLHFYCENCTLYYRAARTAEEIVARARADVTRYFTTFLAFEGVCAPYLPAEVTPELVQQLTGATPEQSVQVLRFPINLNADAPLYRFFRNNFAPGKSVRPRIANFAALLLKYPGVVFPRLRERQVVVDADAFGLACRSAVQALYEASIIREKDAIVITDRTQVSPHYLVFMFLFKRGLFHHNGDRKATKEAWNDVLTLHRQLTSCAECARPADLLERRFCGLAFCQQRCQQAHYQQQLRAQRHTL